MDGNAQVKKRVVLSSRVYIVNNLCNDAGHADQPLEDKAGLEKKSCTSLQRSWKVPPGAGAKSCSQYPPDKEPGCENRPCPAPRMASG